MKHIEEIQELPNRNGFMISVVTDFGAVHETWFYNEVKAFNFSSHHGTLYITDSKSKSHGFIVYGDVTAAQVVKIRRRLAAIAATFCPMNPNYEGYDLCKRLASH